MPYCVGLTGGIGSGKSSAAAVFAQLGAAVVDTDEIAHELTRGGGGAMPEIRRIFGDRYVCADGSLDRAAMRSLVFSDPEQKKKLEAILHPMIREAVRQRVSQAAAPYVVIAVPLLLETGAYGDCIRRVLVVDCEESQQIARTMQRSGLSEAAVRAIMGAQLPRAERLARADDVLRNDRDPAWLRSQVEVLHARYLALARAA